MKRKSILAVLSAMMILIITLGGCAGDTAVGDGNGSKAVGDETDPFAAQSEETTAAAEAIGIKIAELSEYIVVRNDISTEKAVENAKKIYNAISDKFGGGVQIKTDFVIEGNPKYSPGEYEILVGVTNRPESADFTDSMKSNDYGYKIIGKKIVITGMNDNTTAAAVDHFIQNVIDRRSTTDEVFYSNEDDYYFNDKYALESAEINGIKINDFSIVYKMNGTNGEQALAEMLWDAVSRLTGHMLDIKTDKAPGDGSPEILVGMTSRDTGGAYSKTIAENEYYIGGNEKQLLLWGTNATANLSAVNTFIDMLTADFEFGAHIQLDLPGDIMTVSEDDSMSAMSFNVYIRDITNERVDRVIKMVLDYMPDTVGFQEAGSSWMSKLKNRLGTYYSSVGVGRDGGSSGEYNPVFYRKDKFTLLDSGTKWLSDTPDTVSKYEESSLNRIFTYAKLKRNSDGAVFMHINTHLEHTSSAARVKQAEVLVDFIRQYSDIPIILTGDFNCVSTSSEYKTINETFLISSSAAAIKSENTGATYHGYSSANKVIDFIFVSENKIPVMLYTVANNKINGEFASDHHPVYIEYALAK